MDRQLKGLSTAVAEHPALTWLVDEGRTIGGLGREDYFSYRSHFAELLPSKLALIQQWDPDATAARLAPYIASPALRAEHVAAVLAAGARFTWWATARRLQDVYLAAASQPIIQSRTWPENACTKGASVTESANAAKPSSGRTG